MRVMIALWEEGGLYQDISLSLGNFGEGKRRLTPRVMSEVLGSTLKDVGMHLVT